MGLEYYQKKMKSRQPTDAKPHLIIKQSKAQMGANCKVCRWNNQTNEQIDKQQDIWGQPHDGAIAPKDVQDVVEHYIYKHNSICKEWDSLSIHELRMG